MQRAGPGSPPGSKSPLRTPPPSTGYKDCPDCFLQVPRHLTSDFALSFLLTSLLFSRTKNNKWTVVMLGSLHLGLCHWPFKAQGDSPHLGARTILMVCVCVCVCVCVQSKPSSLHRQNILQTFPESRGGKSLLSLTEPL